jgi:hypothetical protein
MDMAETPLAPIPPAGAAYEVTLGGNRTLREAEPSLEALRAALLHPGPVRIDCRDIEAVDLSFLQLIIAAKRSAAAEGVDLTIAAAEAGPLHQAMLDAGIAAPSIGSFLSLTPAN